MGKPPECGNCQKPATIHLTQIVNSQIKKLDFCESCPYQKGITDPQGISLAELLAHGPAPFADGLAMAAGAKMPKCGSCGFTPPDFKKHHRLGCPDCYEELSAFVMPILNNLQKDQLHQGKAPRRMQARLERERRLAALEEQLTSSIQGERYEDAARLRDELRSIREAGNKAAESDPFAAPDGHHLA